MFRFKPSKYKNAVPKVPKKPEGWVLDIQVGSPQSFGNHIAASGAFMAFNIDGRGGGSLGILPLGESGRKSTNLPTLHAHADLVTSFHFSPFDDGLIVTGSQDCKVKLWRIPAEGASGALLNPELQLPLFKHRVESVLFHPTVDSILAISEDRHIRIRDLVQENEFFVNSNHLQLVHSISWKGDGTLLASTSKDCKLQICDPRTDLIVQGTGNHANDRDSRVLWLGNTDCVLTTGFGNGRQREVIIRDMRKFEAPLVYHTGESSMGVLMPLFDPDTNMLFLAGKADTTVCWWDIIDKAPYYVEGSRHIGDVQIKGACLVPKRAMNVMQGEVNRLLLLGHDCVVPVSYQVPRKSYRDYHADLFPDTAGQEPALTFEDWKEGKLSQVAKISLNPLERRISSLQKFGHCIGSGPPKNLTMPQPPAIATQNDSKKEAPKPQVSEKPVLAPKPSPRISTKAHHSLEDQQSASELSGSDQRQMPANVVSPAVHQEAPSLSSQSNQLDNTTVGFQNRDQAPRRSGRGFAMRVSKFRHLNGVILPKETHLTNIKNLCKTVPGESNGFAANEKWAAVPLSGAGGHIAILELSNYGRVQSGVLPCIICGAAAMDFAWDPFNLQRLAVACDDGQIQLWSIPEGGLRESLDTPGSILRGHSEKVTIVKFHPLAAGVLASSSSDLTIKVWDTVQGEVKIVLEGHSDQVFSLAWSSNGMHIASTCKDQRLRLFEPRASATPLQEGPSLPGSRGSRVIWVLGGSHLIVTGFSRVSERQVSLYSVANPSCPLTTVGLDVSPAILVPFYDEDSCTIFLTGKGDATIFAFEVSCDAPFLHPLSSSKFPIPHQGVSYLAKIACDVKEVEFAKAFRLTASTVEPVSFRVPRLRPELFQDDLFPDTRVTWQPTMTAAEWFDGTNREPPKLSLCPDGMMFLSQAPEKKPSASVTVAVAPDPNPELDVKLQFKGDLVLESSLAFLECGREHKERLVNAMMEKMQFDQEVLPQESFEGVDPDEWDETEGSQKG